MAIRVGSRPVRATSIPVGGAGKPPFFPDTFVIDARNLRKLIDFTKLNGSIAPRKYIYDQANKILVIGGPDNDNHLSIAMDGLGARFNDANIIGGKIAFDLDRGKVRIRLFEHSDTFEMFNGQTDRMRQRQIVMDHLQELAGPKAIFRVKVESEDGLVFTVG